MASSDGRIPSWMDWKLAGYSFAYDDTHHTISIHDPKTGFFLVRDVVCDGESLTLLLTRDRKLAAQYGEIDATSDQTEDGVFIQKALTDLSNGHGLRMGDPESRLLALLGKPSSKDIDGSRGQFVVYSYKWRQKGRTSQDMDQNYQEKYTFKKGKLIEVEYDRQAD